MESIKVYFTLWGLQQIGITIGITLLFYFFRKIFTKYLFVGIYRLSKKAPTELFESVLKAYERPLQWLFTIIGIQVAAHYFPGFNEDAPLFIHFVRSSIIFLIFWGLYNLSGSTSALFLKLNEKYNKTIDEILIPILSKTVRVIIILIGLSVVAQEFNYDVNGFIAGLGIGGLAFALAAQDALKNMLGGFIIILEKPFSIGDWVYTKFAEGIVEEITFRSTKFRTFDQALITVPNSLLSNDSIMNWSKAGKRRVTQVLKLPATTEETKIKWMIENFKTHLQQDKDIHTNTITVTFDKYSDAGIEILIVYYTKTTDTKEFNEVKERINFEMKQLFEESMQVHSFEK